MNRQSIHVLLIDDEEAMGRMVQAIMADHGYRVSTFTRAVAALQTLETETYALVITDVKMPGIDGLEVLKRVKAHDPNLPVIIITAHATVEISIQALRAGAYDMLTKPFEPEELLSRVRNALRQSELVVENKKLKAALTSQAGTIVGESSKLRALLELAHKVAGRDIPVLITGESGTGKELVARAVHQFSQRCERQFVAINCGAIPEALLESELFGHRKGAFTGADRDHAGLLEAADGGTLFLDEVGTLPVNVQKTLLRFLQDQEFYRVGDTQPRRVNIRVLSATNTDLYAAVQGGEFREDLYYRLNVINLHLPPLRERRSDIPLLIAHFVQQQNARFGTAVKGFTPEAMEVLQNHDWQGNVRQLSNVVQASMAIDSSEYIDCEVLAQFIDMPAPRAVSSSDAACSELDYASALARFETEYLNLLLDRTGGSVEDMAHHAGINVATIYRKMKKYGLR